MVKGTARNIIVVKSPVADVFEEAIFIVRERPGVTGEAVITEAQEAAKRYIESESGKRPLPPAAYALFGAGGMGILWAISALAGLIK